MRRPLTSRRLPIARKKFDGFAEIAAVQEHDEIDCAAAFGAAAPAVKHLLRDVHRKAVRAAANRTWPGEIALAFDLEAAIADDRQNVNGLGAFEMAREHAHVGVSSPWQSHFSLWQ